MATGATGTTLLAAARAFRPRILAERERIEAGRRLPEDLIRELARAGFFRIFLPAVYGGLDLTPLEAMEVYEELARADASVAWCVWNGNVNWTTAQLSKEVARATFADADVILANSTRPSGQAVVVDGGYRVSGRWSLVSGCQLSTWAILMCIVHKDGKPSLTTWSHAISSCRRTMHRSSPIRSSCRVRATSFLLPPASLLASARSRSALPEARSRRWSI
jgi:alkylation response protein AidB-like acyl-CoA dehydrogenase